MSLLTDDLRTHLPPLYAQEAEDDPLVYARLVAPDEDWAFYITEGQWEGADCRLGGYLAGSVQQWAYLLLSELETRRGPSGAALIRDADFVPGRLTAVVPAPES